MRIAIFVIFCLLICLTCSTVVKKWHRSGDGSLFFIEADQKYNWYEAWNECQRKNMSLIAIDTYERHYQIDVLVKDLFPTCPPFWLAGHDMAVDNRYEWATTGEVFTFSNWGKSQPGRSANEHCILLWNTWDWHDLPCTHKLGFICEANRCAREKSLEMGASIKELDDSAGPLFKTFIWRNYNGNKN